MFERLADVWYKGEEQNARRSGLGFFVQGLRVQVHHFNTEDAHDLRWWVKTNVQVDSKTNAQVQQQTLRSIA